MVNNQQHVGSGDNVAGDKIVHNHNNIYILVAIILAMLIALIVWVGKCGSEPFFCGQQECEKCMDCYELGCFDIACNCFQENGEQEDGDSERKTVCSKVTKADGLLLENNIDLAFSFYKEAASIDKVIVYKFRGGIMDRFAKVERAEQLAKAEDYDGAIADLENAKEESKGNADFSDEANAAFNEYLNDKIEALEKEKRNRRILPTGFWNGKWKQSKSGKQGQISGFVEFEITDETKGKYTNIYHNGISHKGEFIDIKVSENQLSGKWHNFYTDEYGLFELEKIGNQFKGKYSMSLDEKPAYYWNGRKK